MTAEEDASDESPGRAMGEEGPGDADQPRPARAADRGAPADGGGAPRRVPRLRPGPDRARRRALGRRWDVLRGLRSQGLCRGPAETRSRVRRGADGPDAHAAPQAGGPPGVRPFRPRWLRAPPPARSAPR